MKDQNIHKKNFLETERILSFFKQINNWLFGPSRYIIDAGERKQAELIAKLSFFFSLLIFSGLIASTAYPEKNQVGSFAGIDSGQRQRLILPGKALIHAQDLAEHEAARI